MERNLSVNAWFRQIAKEHKPENRFDGTGMADWEKWHKMLLPAAKATLGRMPTKVPLNPETIVEWEADGLLKQKVIFDVQKGLSATAYVFRPAKSSKYPGILACHGHGLGKETVMGNDSTGILRTEINACRYDYGLKMAQAGYAVISIDWRGFGERDDRKKPHYNDNIGSRDICNLHFNRAVILGMTMLGLNVHDGMCALDYICNQNFVNSERVGVMGLSFGGTMATWMSLCDERIKATDIICYSDRFSDFGIRDNNFCGSQITPGIYSLCDVPDLQGLIAPRPLMVEIGTYDSCFCIDSAMSCFKEVEKIYAAANASGKLYLELFEGPHAWSGNSGCFFDKYLKS